jgi:predicted transcriptional regulator
MNKDNILRGKILDILRKIYPDGVDHKTMVSILFQYHKTEEISSSLEYLVDKEYVLKKEHPHSFLTQETIKWYKLTPKGIDLLEGNVNPDPGILIQRG